MININSATHYEDNYGVSKKLDIIDHSPRTTISTKKALNNKELIALTEKVNDSKEYVIQSVLKYDFSNKIVNNALINNAVYGTFINYQDNPVTWNEKCLRAWIHPIYNIHSDLLLLFQKLYESQNLDYYKEFNIAEFKW